LSTEFLNINNSDLQCNPQHPCFRPWPFFSLRVIKPQGRGEGAGCRRQKRSLSFSERASPKRNYSGLDLGLIFEGSCPLVPKPIQAENHYLYSMGLAAGVPTERLAWQAGMPRKPWQNSPFPQPPEFLEPSKIRPAPTKVMEMLLKRETGTANSHMREKETMQVGRCEIPCREADDALLVDQGSRIMSPRIFLSMVRMPTVRRHREKIPPQKAPGLK